LGTRLIIFDANQILKLLTHYTDGQVPLDAELLSFGVSQFMERWLGLECRSSQWVDGTPIGSDGLSPLHIRYEGKRLMSLGNLTDQPGWFEAPDSPTRK
jgi:hypothetical protein